MVEISKESSIRVQSSMTEWMNVIFLVSKKDEVKAGEVLQRAFDDFWEQEDVCYGDWLKEKMEEAGIEFEMFFGEERNHGADQSEKISWQMQGG